MKLSDFDYKYPEDAIAIRPPKVRGTSKLFVVYTQTGEIDILKYKDLPKVLTGGDILIRNVTKVINSRIFTTDIVIGEQTKQKAIEILILSSGSIVFAEYLSRQFDRHSQSFFLPVLVRAKQKLKEKVTWYLFKEGWKGRIVLRDGEQYLELFYPKAINNSAAISALLKFLEKHGGTPIPPYLKRTDDKGDKERYQTVFGTQLGSAAAPTASLNFTNEIEAKLKRKGVYLTDVTLHVGLGTFAPLYENTIEKNTLHAEVYNAPEETLQLCKDSLNSARKIIAMGTTAMRAIESAAINSNNEIAATNLFIYHPYNFKIITGLLTNFHVPQSSLLVLVDAFLRYKNSKLSWKHIYEFAIKNDAKLFSYGDSMLII
ncbi:MAG: tRNA preQ1(34) S-adenosylmethionine ribosyltransferase-isomerase QueA [Candidatus Dojkabacteria bacterium]|nr:MAG: tRNA preQ1(34) S-adenosylmethionine ribosyltransferase-isomerase QueA [Candidatus Dojkabacteria bacterium]